MSYTGARSSPAISPWRLTPRQAQVMDACCRYGHNHIVAQRMALSLKTVELYVVEVRDRMAELLDEGDEHLDRARMAAAWAVWRLEQGINLATVPRKRRKDRRPRYQRTVPAEAAAGDGVALRCLTALNELDNAIRPKAAV